MRTSVQGVGADGAATLIATFESVRVESDGAGGRVVYDSEADPPPTDPKMKMHAALVGWTLTMTIASDGRVLAADGGADFMKRMTGVVGDAAGAEVTKQAGSFFDPSQMAQMWGSSNQLPSTPVRTGDTWERSDTLQVPVLGSMKTTSNFKVASIDGPTGKETVRITFTQHTVHGRPDTSGRVGSAPLPEFGDGKTNGEMLFSIKRGQMIRHTTQSNTTLKLKFSADRPALESKTRSTMTFELLPDSPPSSGK